MKTPSDNLYLLIKSLTKTEKRYFKLFARIHAGEEDTSYVTLFDAIEEQDAYDESKIKQKLSGTALAKNLAVAKNYLYKLVLKSLLLYGANNDTFEEVVQQFTYGKILYKKGLHDQALVLIEKAKTKSLENELFLLAADIEKWSRRISSRQPNYANKENIFQRFDQIFTLIKKEEGVLNQILFNDILMIPLRKTQQARKKEEIEELTKSIKPYLKPVKAPYESESAHRMWHESNAMYYFFIGDYNKQYEEMKAAFHWASKNKNNIVVYHNVLINYFVTCQVVKKYDECKWIVKEIETMDIGGALSADLHLSVLFWVKLYMWLGTGNFDEGKRYVKSVEKRILSLDMKSYYYNLQGGGYAAAYLFFIQGNYSETLKWLNKFYFFKKNEFGVRDDLFFKASLLYMLVHYELKNEELLKYVIKHTYKWLLKANALNDYEKTLLSFIRKEMAIPKTHKEMLPAYEKLKDKLSVLAKDPLNMAVVDQLDLAAWLESKINKKSFEEVLKKKIEAEKNK